MRAGRRTTSCRPIARRSLERFRPVISFVGRREVMRKDGLCCSKPSPIGANLVPLPYFAYKYSSKFRGDRRWLRAAGIRIAIAGRSIHVSARPGAGPGAARSMRGRRRWRFPSRTVTTSSSPETNSDSRVVEGAYVRPFFHTAPMTVRKSTSRKRSECFHRQRTERLQHAGSAGSMATRSMARIG